MNIKQLNQVKNNAILIHDQHTINKALLRLTKQLTQDYSTKSPVFLVVMSGAFVFAGKLLPQLNFPAQIDYCHATRYRGNTLGGDIEWKVEPHSCLRDRHVIIIDDILDEGHTLQSIIDYCHQAKVSSVKTVVLVEKEHSRKATPEMHADYCELTVPDKYVFGYGMDYNHYWRNCEEIYYLKETPDN